MSRKSLILIIAAVALVASVIGLGAAISYYTDLPNRLSQHETIVLGQSAFVPGSQAALRVLVRDSKDASPLEGAEIRVSMQPKAGGAAVALYTGTTDKSGTANVAFKVPAAAAPEQNLIIETKSSLG